MSDKRPTEHEEVLGAKDASVLIATIRPATLLASLKDPDFAMVVGLAFAGFRFDTNGLANPLVRRRLADEATRNTHFAGKLRELGEQARAAAGPRPVAAQPSQPSAGHAISTAAPPQPDRSAEKYREERDRLKREATDEADRRRVAERDLGQAKLDALAATTARAEADREAMRLKQRAERLDRKLRRVELENAQLRRVIGTSSPAASEPPAILLPPARTPEAGQQGDSRADAPFVDAVRHMLDKQKWQPAKAIADDVLRQLPANEEALTIRAAASEALGDLRAAVGDLRSLCAVQTERGDLSAAAKTLAQLYSKTDKPAQESKAAREFFVALGHAGGYASDVRATFDALKQSAPAAYAALKDAAQGDVAAVLFADRPIGRIGPDDPLPISLGAGLPRSVTGRLAAGWIDHNDSAIVDGLRTAVADADAPTLTRLAAALEAATSGDGGYYRLLTRKSLAGAAVVDASNAAWSGQEMIASPRPRLAQVTALRGALREKGYFPVLLIADANFPHVVDDPPAARKMVADGHVTLAPSGTDADVLILQEARRLHAPVVSNDYMAEWDLEQEVTKLQYSISPTGAVTVYR